MAFPQIASVTKTTYNTNRTTYSVAMPATVNAGDALICACAMGFFSKSGSAPSGWTGLQTGSESGVYAKVATGDEGGTSVTFTNSGTASFGAFAVFRITNWYAGISGVQVGTLATSGFSQTTTPNPPSITASWGAEDNLFIALGMPSSDTGGANQPTAYPANYTDNQDYARALSGNKYTLVAYASRELAAATEDPGTFTLQNADLWHAQTIVVRPSALPDPASGTASAEINSLTASGSGSQVEAKARSMVVIT